MAFRLPATRESDRLYYTGSGYMDGYLAIIPIYGFTEDFGDLVLLKPIHSLRAGKRPSSGSGLHLQDESSILPEPRPSGTDLYRGELGCSLDPGRTQRPITSISQP